VARDSGNNPADLESVAKHAGVSISTVSRALTRPDRVATATRERVLESAAVLGYAPNQLARSLRMQGSRTIGLIISDILVPFHSEVAKGVEDIASAHHYTTILCNSSEDGSKEKQYLELLKGFKVGGVILEPTEAGVATIEALARAGTPVVEVDRISGARGVSAILSDNIDGARQAAQYLLGLGHSSFGMIAGDTMITSGRERLQGFEEELNHQNVKLEANRIVRCRNTDASGYDAFLRLFDQPEPPKAVFVGNFQMMGGVLRAVRKLGLRVPKDLSLIGFDDSTWASVVDPPITVIAQQAYELGRMAAQMILDSIEGKKTKLGVTRLPTKLIERESCAQVLPLTGKR
jgi:LacI family transcriptional regulator, repressor for deo operon, udp, cdd, tsx, nupC, and nupG